MNEVTKKTLTIDITGGPATGKSAVAFAIKKTLHEFGIIATIEGSEDESPLVLENDWQARLESLPAFGIKIRTIRDSSAR
jgi:uridine kinase